MQTSSPEVKATAYLVSIKTATDHIAPSKHIHAHVHVGQALPGLCHHPLQVVLPPVIVGKEAITGVEEDPERWQGPAEARPSRMGHPAAVSTPDSHGHTSPRDRGCPCLPHSAPCGMVPHSMPTQDAHTGCPVTWPAHLPSRPPYAHLFCSFSSSCHLSCPLCTTLSYHSTRPPGTC